MSFQGDGSGPGQRPNPEDLWKERMKGLVIDFECLPYQDVGEYNQLEFDHNGEIDEKGEEYYRIGKITE